MLILSDFHDYYDVVTKQGIDKSIVYDRRETKIPLDQFNSQCIQDYPVIREFYEDIKYYSSHTMYSCRIESVLIIGFCGKFYPCIEFYEEGCPPAIPTAKTYIHYTYKDTEEFMKLRLTTKDLEAFFAPKSKFPRHHSFINKLDQHGLKALFSKYSGVKNDELFIKTKAPVVIYQNNQYHSLKHTIYTNYSLKKLQFYKAIDPYMAYQELTMYISGVLGTSRPEPIEISDRDMKFKKGFDEKSFRTDPGTRKPRWLKRKLRNL